MYPYLLLIILISVLFFHRDIKENLTMILSPLSKSELSYDPKRWNRSEDKIQKYNNCYAYATNDLEINRHKKPHPGHKSGIDSGEQDYQCPIMNKYVFMDYPDAYKTDFETPCKCNHYKVYLTVDPKNDFHLYRQDSNGFWSHKPGSRKVTNIDASGNYITNPGTADREYKSFNYSDGCMYFCVPRKNEFKKDCSKN